MTDFKRMTKMAEEIGDLRAYVKIAKEIIEKTEFEKYSFAQIQKEVWLESITPLLERHALELEEILNGEDI